MDEILKRIAEFRAKGVEPKGLLLGSEVFMLVRAKCGLSVPIEDVSLYGLPCWLGESVAPDFVGIVF